MEVLNQRAALLCNYEVLCLLKELENEHLAKTRTALRIKKEEEASGVLSHHVPEVLENLRTIEVEAIQYLSADYQPTNMQTEAGIAQLNKGLAPYGLTKAERLQIVNLAPTEPVELYVIVEELEDRLGDKMDEILTVVRTSLNDTAAPTSTGSGDKDAEAVEVREEPQAEVYNVDEGWDYDNGVAFDDTGEGVGVEGDLDKEDDDD